MGVGGGGGGGDGAIDGCLVGETVVGLWLVGESVGLCDGAVVGAKQALQVAGQSNRTFNSLHCPASETHK